MSRQEQQVLTQFLESEYATLAGRVLDREAIAASRESEEFEEVERQSNVALALADLDMHWRKRKDIRRALERLGGGEYGLCVECEDEIGEKRLKALPWATLCLSCQQEREEVLAA